MFDYIHLKFTNVFVESFHLTHQGNTASLLVKMQYHEDYLNETWFSCKVEQSLFRKFSNISLLQEILSVLHCHLCTPDANVVRSILIKGTMKTLGMALVYCN